MPTFNGSDITLLIVAFLVWRYLTTLGARDPRPAAQSVAPIVVNLRDRLWEGFLKKGGGEL